MKSGSVTVEHRLRFWRCTTRLLQMSLGLIVLAAVWILGFSAGDDVAPVVPDGDPQFSLDLEVVATVDHDLVYAVEQRARPFYRIFSFDPKTGNDETIYEVPVDAIIYGISLDPTADTLAVAYTPDFEIGGSGIWTLDLATGEMDMVIAAESDIYLTDPTWSADGRTIFVSHVDRRGDVEELSAAAVSLGSGSLANLAEDAIEPVQLGETIYYLNVDDDQARRTIGALGTDGSHTTIDVGPDGADLDQLLAGHDQKSLFVAVLETNDGGLSIGQPASAHGNHEVPSAWWTVSDNDDSELLSTDLEPIIVYDAISTSQAIVYATNEGLSIGQTARADVIKSRAIRFVAG